MWDPPARALQVRLSCPQFLGLYGDKSRSSCTFPFFVSRNMRSPRTAYSKVQSEAVPSVCVAGTDFRANQPRNTKVLWHVAPRSWLKTKRLTLVRSPQQSCCLPTRRDNRSVILTVVYMSLVRVLTDALDPTKPPIIVILCCQVGAIGTADDRDLSVQHHRDLTDSEMHLIILHPTSVHYTSSL